MGKCFFAAEPSRGKLKHLVFKMIWGNQRFNWFHSIKAVQLTVKVARYDRRRSAFPTAAQKHWETIPPSFDTSFDHYTKTAAATTSSVIDLTFNKTKNEYIDDSPPCAQRAWRSDNPPGSSQPPSTSYGLIANLPASVAASAPPVSQLLKVKKLDNSNWTPLSAPIQPPELLNNNPLDLLTQKHMSMLQQLSHLVIGDPMGSFAGTSTDLAH